MDKIITDKMTIDLNMFSLFMKDIIVSNMNSTLVVTIFCTKGGESPSPKYGFWITHQALLSLQSVIKGQWKPHDRCEARAV